MQPLEASSKRESIPLDYHVNMPNFTEETSMFRTCYQKCFGLYV